MRRMIVLYACGNLNLNPQPQFDLYIEIFPKEKLRKLIMMKIKSRKSENSMKENVNQF